MTQEGRTMKTALISLIVLTLLSGCCVYRDAYKEYGDCDKCEHTK